MNFLRIYALVLLRVVLSVDSNVETVYAREGHQVTLQCNFQLTKDDEIKWYFKSTLIAQIDIQSSQTCTDVHCNEDNERLRGRVKLNQTGSLTILNTMITDDGEYRLMIINTGSDTEKTFRVVVIAVSDLTTAVNPNVGNGAEGQIDTSNPDSGLSGGPVAGICIGVILSFICIACAVVLYYSTKKTQRRQEATLYTAVQIPDNH